MRRRPIASLLVFSFLLGVGCTHVKLEPQADAVAAVESVDPAECKRLGKTNVRVLSKVLFVRRKKEKVARELEVMARNEAAAMGGNAVLAESEVDNGRRTFGIYDCPASGDEEADGADAGL